MKRVKTNLSHYHLTTCDMGELIPVSCVEVLPGDTFQGSTSALIRVSPLVAPVMHPVQVRLHHFFVPNRIIWDEWETFITGGDGFTTPPDFPVTSRPIASEHTIVDYLGIPPVDGLEFSQLPIRCYNAIYNEFYRDQDLQIEATENNTTVRRCAWEKDYFGKARPWPQKSDQITVPLGARTVEPTSGLPPEIDTSGFGPDAVIFGVDDLNALREGFALQRYAEARARYGSRYVEYLRYCGVNPSDARLQRPEYLGGGSTSINFSEVLNTAGDPQGVSTQNVGDLHGHGIAAMRTNNYRKFFEEHGHVMTMMSVRPKAIYTNGMPRKFNRRDKEDFYTKELAHIGQQAIKSTEIFAEAAPLGDETFGWVDRYDEYRHEESHISSEFRELLNYWHLGRNWQGTGPALNEDFIECEPSKRIHNDQDNNTLWCMISHKIVARRMMSRSSAPKVM